MVMQSSQKKYWWLLQYDDPETGEHFDFEWEANIGNERTMKTHRPIFTTLVLLFLLILTSCGKGKVYRLIQVESFKGDVRLTEEGKPSEVFAGKNLISGDRIETGISSELLMLIDSDKHVNAGAETSFTVEASGDSTEGGIKIVLDEGNALFTIDEALPQHSTFEVVTNNATLAVRGTTFHVVYDKEDDSTDVSVTEGTVEVTYAGQEKISVTAGQRVIVKDNEATYETDTEDKAEEGSEEEGPVKREISETHYDENDAVVLSVKYEYDDRRLSRIIAVDKDGIKTEYPIEYDAEGRALTEYSLSYGRIGIGSIEYEGDGSVVTYDQGGYKTVYYKDKEGKTLRLISYDNEGDYQYTQTVEYYPDGKVKRYTLTDKDDSVLAKNNLTMALYSEFEYETDAGGHAVKNVHKNTYEDGTSDTVTSIFESEYDEEGELISSVETVYEDDKTTPWYTYTTTVSEDGLKKTKVYSGSRNYKMVTEYERIE